MQSLTVELRAVEPPHGAVGLAAQQDEIVRAQNRAQELGAEGAVNRGVGGEDLP